VTQSSKESFENNLTTTSSACAGCGSRALSAVGSAFAVVSTRAFAYSFTSLSIIQSISFHKKRQRNKQFKREIGKMVVWLPWQQSLVMLIPLGSFYQLQ
jgi:hypothetical protein